MIEFTKKEKKQIKEIVLPILKKLRHMEAESTNEEFALAEGRGSNCWIDEICDVENMLSAAIREDLENV